MSAGKSGVRGGGRSETCHKVRMETGSRSPAGQPAAAAAAGRGGASVLGSRGSPTALRSWGPTLREHLLPAGVRDIVFGALNQT